MDNTSGLQMKYFVLKPAGDNPYSRASRIAMREYAKAIEHVNPELASKLFDWAGAELAKIQIDDSGDK